MVNSSHLARLRVLTKSLKKLPGTVLFLNPIRKYFSKYTDCLVVKDFDGDGVMRLCLNEHIQSQIFWFGYYSRDIVYQLDKLLQKEMVVVDVGANIGEITIASARRVGEKGTVYAFEPMKSLWERLRDNISLNNLNNIEVVNLGLSDKRGEASLYSHIEDCQDGTQNDGLASLYRSSVRSSLVDTVELTTLDAFVLENGIEKIDLIKIDVEGAELSVLKGGELTISNMHPLLIIEVQRDSAQDAGYQAPDIIRLISEWGYKSYIIGRKGRLSEVSEETLGVFQNVLCVPSEIELN